MYKIRLNDASEYTVRWCGENSGILVIDLVCDLSLLGVATVFSNAEAVSKIQFLYDESLISEYEGYSEPIVINKSGDNEYLVSLK